MNPQINIINIRTSAGGLVESFAPGELISDPTLQARIIAAGGVLAPQSPIATAAAALATEFRARGDSRSAELVMLAALGSAGGVPAVATAQLVGPGAASGSPLLFDVPSSGAVFGVDIVAVGQVTKVGTAGTEALGDTYSIAAHLTAKLLSGALVIVPSVARVPTVDADASMSDATATPSTSGAQLAVSLQNGAKIGAGAVIAWTVTATAAAVG